VELFYRRLRWVQALAAFGVCEIFMAVTDRDDEQFEQVAQSLEWWLACQATDDVPELVLVGLLRGYADAIEEQGYVPRSWHDHVEQVDSSVVSQTVQRS